MSVFSALTLGALHPTPTTTTTQTQGQPMITAWHVAALAALIGAICTVPAIRQTRRDMWITEPYLRSDKLRQQIRQALPGAVIGTYSNPSGNIIVRVAYRKRHYRTQLETDQDLMVCVQDIVNYFNQPRLLHWIPTT